MVERICIIGEKETKERRYFIGSINADATLFSKAVRRIRKGSAPAIMTTIRHLCMGLFDKDSSIPSLAKKKRKACWSDDYRAKLVFGKEF